MIGTNIDVRESKTFSLEDPIPKESQNSKKIGKSKSKIVLQKNTNAFSQTYANNRIWHFLGIFSEVGSTHYSISPAYPRSCVAYLEML